MGARRRRSSERRLALNQIVDAAVKIIGENRARRADIEATLDYVSKLCQRSNHTRSRESKNQRLFANRYGAALRKVIAMAKNTSTDFRLWPQMQYSVKELGIDREVFDHEHFLHHLRLLARICESWEKPNFAKPRPNAYEKRLAAGAALHLLKSHSIKPTTTKTGTLCRLAAVLYGDKGADLQHHCREEFRRRKSGQKQTL